MKHSLDMIMAWFHASLTSPWWWWWTRRRVATRDGLLDGLLDGAGWHKEGKPQIPKVSSICAQRGAGQCGRPTFFDAVVLWMKALLYKVEINEVSELKHIV